jgi:hypothetical protein
LKKKSGVAKPARLMAPARLRQSGGVRRGNGAFLLNSFELCSFNQAIECIENILLGSFSISRKLAPEAWEI